MQQDTVPAKPCAKCSQVKPLSEFYRQKTCRDGYRPTCKVCARADGSARYVLKMRDPEFAAHRKSQMKGALRRRYESLDAEGLQRQRAMTADWRSRNRHATAEQYRAWRIANAQRVLEKNHRRRARLLNAFVAPVDPAAIWERDGGICQLCSAPIDPLLEWPDRMSRTLDHVVPLARGGTHEPANVQLAHAVCNSRKGDRAEA